MEIYGEWAIIERFVLEFNSMVVETKGIWIASWLVIGRRTEGRKRFFLHYNWKKAKAEDIPLVFSFFPSSFIPSRLHIVACPDIKDCEKMILPIFGKPIYFSSILGACQVKFNFEIAVRDDFTYINQHFLAHILPLTFLFQFKIVSWL